MSVYETRQAVEAAGAAIWQWEISSGKFSIRSEPPGIFCDLSGDWLSEELLLQVEGLWRERLRDKLENSVIGTAINEHFEFVDGRHAKLIGAFIDHNTARGLLLDETHNTTYNDTDILPTPDPAFQPIISNYDGTIVGFEALARWRNPEGKSVSAQSLPDGAYRLANAALAPAMLKAACSALADWRRLSGYENLFMHVNLTGIDLCRPQLINLATELVHKFKLPPGTLKIELTEQAALRDFERSIAAAAALKAAGIGLILDDFGSGHSSFVWLAEIPADGLKIDPKLIQMVGRPRSDAIISSIAGLGRALDMTVTAEGVEETDYIDFLRAVGCNYVQGFAYSHPLPRDKVRSYLLHSSNAQFNYARPASI